MVPLSAVSSLQSVRFLFSLSVRLIRAIVVITLIIVIIVRRQRMIAAQRMMMGGSNYYSAMPSASQTVAAVAQPMYQPMPGDNTQPQYG